MALYLPRGPGTYWSSTNTCGMTEDQTWSCTADPTGNDSQRKPGAVQGCTLTPAVWQAAMEACRQAQSTLRFLWAGPLSATQAQKKGSGGRHGWQGTSRSLGSHRRPQVLGLRPCPQWLLDSWHLGRNTAQHRPGPRLLQVIRHVAVEVAPEAAWEAAGGHRQWRAHMGAALEEQPLASKPRAPQTAPPPREGVHPPPVSRKGRQPKAA